MKYNGIVYDVTGDYDTEYRRLAKAFQDADAVIVGAGSGLSTSAGFNYGGERLQELFGDFVEKYGMPDIYHGCFANFESNEERWAYWARWSYYHAFCPLPKDTLVKLRELLEGKDYFVLTTNVDHTFQRAGYDKNKLCYTQGDLGLFQCSVPCHSATYDNYETILAMHEQERDMKVPTELIPHCPKCGREMDFNLYWDNTFVRDEGWHIAHKRYEDYLAAHQTGKVLYLELGVGFNSPGVIKVPFWQMAIDNRDAAFASINLDNPSYPEVLEGRAIVISHDIDEVIRKLLAEQKG